MIKLKSYAPTVLRVGISIIIIWFGSQQLIQASDWVAYLPAWITSFGVTAETIVHLNGLFEVIFGLFMLVGFYTRFVALFLALHMLEIVHVVGYGPTGARDLAIAISLISIFFQGADDFSLDTKWQR